jgi:hypothetical protein
MNITGHHLHSGSGPILGSRIRIQICLELIRIPFNYQQIRNHTRFCSKYAEVTINTETVEENL